MKLHQGRYPVGAVLNADFVTRSSKCAAGQRIVDLQVDTAALPSMGGMLCLHESTVKQMVDMLGWKLDDGTDQRQQVAKLNTKVASLEAKLTRIRKAAK